MSTYRTVWLLLFSALAATGCGVGLAVSPTALATVAGPCAVVGSILALATWSVARQPGRRRWFVVVLRGAALGGVLGGAALGLTAALGTQLLLLALCLLGSSPAAVGAYVRWLDAAPRPTATDVDAVATALSWASPGYVPLAPEPDLRCLTDEDLCRRWAASSEELAGWTLLVPSPEAVDERQALLDELERRHPARLRAWLVSGAPTAASLAQHLAAAPDAVGTIDWDDLLLRGE